MSTLNNYLFQSFNFRSKSKLRSIYDVVASITAEEVGHVELVSNGVALLNNGPDGDETGGADVSGAPFAPMEDIRLAASFLSNGGGAMPVDSNGLPWNGTFVTTTGNVIMDMLFNFHLECGARIHKLRVYETMTEPVGREVCGYLLVRGSVHAHAYALVLKKLTGVAIERMLPVPNIDLDRIPECRKYLAEGRHRLLYTNSPSDDYRAMAGIWGNGETALPGDPPGELEVVDGVPDGGKIPDLNGMASAFTPQYAPEEMFEIASKLHAASR
jgi:Mn-containing catalase